MTPRALFDRIEPQLNEVVKGKEKAKQVIFATILARGNILLEGPPGIAKTLLARALAGTLGLASSRVQFTPDLMPSDILGTSIFNPGTKEFEFVKGPIFADFIIADEINRSPAKTQAALLEAMEEKQVTADNQTYPMSDHFVVFATQNPLEYEGTYRLPEAQLDRFMVRVRMEYPEDDTEMEIMKCFRELYATGATFHVEPKASPRELEEAREALAGIVVDEKIQTYVKELIRFTRTADDLLLGNSPRAGIMLLTLGCAYSAVLGDSYVTPDHIRELVPMVLPHRWILRPEAEVQRVSEEAILAEIFDKAKIPV